VPQTEEPLTTQHFPVEESADDGDAAARAQTPAEQAPQDAHAVPFRDLGVADIICQGLASAGIYTTFPIQALALPIALGGQDIIGQARTGTGKTLAFGTALLQRLADDQAFKQEKRPKALIVVPTRELAVQVAGDIEAAGAYLGARVLTVYGGRAYEPQIEALKSGIDIVVGTPGRLLDLANRRNLNLSAVQALVLDEADKMLDLGFLPDVERIINLIPSSRQTMLFSATMPGEVVTLARRHMRRAVNIRAEEPDESQSVTGIEQHVFRTHHLDKIEVLARVLQAKDRGLSMVFTQTKRTADQVSHALTGRGFAVGTVHGDLGQAQRERALRAFRNGKVDVLVATDVAARGIDIDDVTHVINYECPEDEKTYLHRVGRTGRAGRAGVAVTFVDWQDMQRWKLISTALDLNLPEPPETYSTSEHLFAEMAIPPHVTGTLPREQRDRDGLAAEAAEDLGETGRKRSQTPRARREPAAPRKRRRRTRNGREVTRDSEGYRKLSLDSVSTPTSLALPEGVRRTSVVTTRGVFAALEAVPIAGPCERGTALLVPGYTGSKEDFLTVLERLAAAGRRVLAIDQRGQYQTPGSADPDDYHLDALGDDVAAVVSATGASHLLGHSFGGLVTRETVLDQAPLTFTLMSSGPGALTGARAAELRTMMAAIGTDISASRIRQIWDGYLEPQTRANGTPEPIVAFLRDRMLGSSPTGLVMMARELLNATDRTEELAKLDYLPIMVIYGEDDNAWSPQAQEDMAARLGAHRVCIPGAAHSPAVEAPATTADALTRFWNAAELSGRPVTVQSDRPTACAGLRRPGPPGSAAQSHTSRTWLLAAAGKRRRCSVPACFHASARRRWRTRWLSPRHAPGAWPASHRCGPRPAPHRLAGGAVPPACRSCAASARPPGRRAPAQASCARHRRSAHAGQSCSRPRRVRPPRRLAAGPAGRSGPTA
jgi:superfamily II DNA/RNA helicase/alpha-beta hydrolase superfamily lysophospholipase